MLFVLPVIRQELHRTVVSFDLTLYGDRHHIEIEQAIKFVRRDICIEPASIFFGKQGFDRTLAVTDAHYVPPCIHLAHGDHVTGPQQMLQVIDV